MVLLQGYKSVQHVTVLNTVGNCNAMVSIIILYYNIILTIILYHIILYYNIMGPPLYMRSVVDRNIVMRRMTVVQYCTEVPLFH